MSTITPPAGLAVMTAKKRWVGFRREARPGEAKPTKVPYQVARDERGRDQKAKAGDLATFDTFAAVAEAVAAGRFDGFGYELLIEDGIFFLDLDGVRDPETHRLTPLARSVVSLLNTYAAPSISGTGVHVYGLGQLPAALLTGGREGRKIGNFELYAGKHFATETFQPFPGYDTVRAVDADTMHRLVLLLWPDEFGRHGEVKDNNVILSPPAPAIPDDLDLLAKAFDAHGGGDLYQRHNGQYLLDDKSADDFAYLGALRFWTQADPARMRRLALSSNRARDKWATRRGASDWLDYSIASVNEKGGEVYDPGRGGGNNRRSTPSRGDNSNLAPDAELIATLRADVARLGDELRDRDRTIVRLQGDLAEVTEERDFYKACTECPDPVVGRALPAIAEELHRSYRRGSPRVQRGHEFARLSFEKAAEGKPINRSAIASAAARLGPDTPHDTEVVKTVQRGREVDTTLHYFACPVEERASVIRLGLGLLRRANPQCHHQGRKPKKALPPAVAAQDAPVRREHRLVETYYSLRDPDGKPLATQTTIGTADYWTPDGEQLTREAARDWQVARGIIPPPVETQHHPTPHQSRFVGDRPAPRGVEPQQTTTRDRGVEPQHPLPLDAPGQCADRDCGHPAVRAGYCERHYAEQLARHRQAWAYQEPVAAGDD